MAKFTIRELIAAFRELIFVEPNEFIKAFKEELDVTAAAPVAAVAAVPAVGGEAAAVEEEKDSFDVVPEAIGDKEAAVIKGVRTLTSLGLKEAKDLADSAPKAVLEGVDKGTANKAEEQLEGAGTSVTIK